MISTNEAKLLFIGPKFYFDSMTWEVDGVYVLEWVDSTGEIYSAVLDAENQATLVLS